MTLSRLLLVRQKLPDRSIARIEDEVRRELAQAALHTRLRPGARVAIGVGSRGISNLDRIVKTTVDWWKSAGMEPFIFPAMGSHGAATAEGQRAVLARYGVTDGAMGCPVLSSLDVVSLGRTDDDIEVFADKNAFEADAVVPVARVKWHTDFAGKLESGLFKMLAIGMGKFAGARLYHAHAFRFGMEHVIRTAGRKLLASGKVIGGLAILEDAYHNTAKLSVLPAERMEAGEEELLVLVKSWMGRVPFDTDVLIVDEMGKQISGAGMDSKVINRSAHGGINCWDTAPHIERIYIRDLSEHSYGNAVGIGMADVTHRRILEKIDWDATKINALTAGSLPSVRTPIWFDSDRECLDRTWPSVGKLDAREVRAAWIRNTLELAVLGLTENYRADVEADPNLEIIAGPLEWPFDEAGELPRYLPAHVEAAY
jgi:hypothetical protein